MKTLTYFFALLLSVVFSMEIEAQGVTDVTTSIIQHNSTNTKSIDISPNGEYVVVAIDGYPDMTGKAGVYYNNCASYTFGHEITTFILPKGTIGAAGVKVYEHTATISNNGNAYFFFKSTVIGTTAHAVLRKNDTEIMSFDGIGARKLKVFNGYLYLFTADGTGNYWLLKIDENTDQVVYNTPVIHGNISEMLLMPNGNIAGKVRSGAEGGDLYEFDANTGVEIQKVHDYPGDGSNAYNVHYQYSDTGFLEYKDMNGVWRNEHYQTDMPASYHLDLFQSGAKNWREVPNNYYFVAGNDYFCLSKKVIHGERNRLNASTYGYALDSWVNDDGSFTFVTKHQGNTAIHLVKIIPDFHVNNFVNCVNPGGMNIINIHNGEVYENGQWTAGYNEHTIVYANASDIPAIGTTPNSSLMDTTPSGMTLWGITPIENLVRNGQNQTVFNAVYRSPDQARMVYIRVHLVTQAEVTGIPTNNLANFKVWPNPATTYLQFSAEKKLSQVEILDMGGRSIMKRENVEGSVFVGNLTPGIYFIRVRSGNQTGTRKWVKL